ncbi:MAG: hypothetical protein QOD77_1485 [Thermoplasmata archaeon]|nr:hypothetical protein [Thermoplasmata archaeon]
MRPIAAWLLVGATAAATAAAFLLPPAAVAALAVAGFLLAPTWGIVVFAAVALAFQALLFGLVIGEPTWTWGPVALRADGAVRGAQAALRLVAAVAVNSAVLRRVGVARIVDGLRLPRRATAVLAAILLAAQEVARDAARLVDARRRVGAWPPGRLARVRAAAGLLPAILVASLRRARVRTEAMRLAGLRTRPGLEAVIALAAVALAGRLATTGVNVSLAYAVVFLGGVLFGARVAAAAGALAMLLSDLLLSGLAPAAFVNVPAMAVLGVLGGALRHLDWQGRSPADRAAVRVLAACTGFVATLVFSVAADVATWLLVPELAGSGATLAALLASGLLFNLAPAAVNAALFAAAVPATVAAWRAVATSSAAAPSR